MLLCVNLFRKDIVQWNDIVMGNCFTFNHKDSLNERFSVKPGRDVGKFEFIYFYLLEFVFYVKM